jgi:nucleotide-binding universal stress UspA family protein
MKTILIATDFSQAALNAANYAADMALAIDANIILLHAYQIPVIYLETYVAVIEGDMTQDTKKTMVQLKNHLAKKTGGKLNIQTEIRQGVFFSELKTLCEKINPYAVVMGSQGTTAAEHLFFGSHAVFAMKHLRWPLITVPPKVKFASIKEIGLACDFNKVVDAVPVDEIKMLVNDYNAKLHVLNISRKEGFNPDVVFQSGLLQEILKPLKPQYHFISNKNTDEGIMNFAEKNHIDLLITLPRRHGLLKRLIHKSHTKQLVLHSHVPVMALNESSY